MMMKEEENERQRVKEKTTKLTIHDARALNSLLTFGM